MFIEIKDLEINPVDFREEFSPGLIDLGEEVRQRSPLCTSVAWIWSKSTTASTRWCGTSG